jgi:hypothetical protein
MVRHGIGSTPPLWTRLDLPLDLADVELVDEPDDEIDETA